VAAADDPTFQPEPAVTARVLDNAAVDDVADDAATHQASELGLDAQR